MNEANDALGDPPIGSASTFVPPAPEPPKPKPAKKPKPKVAVLNERLFTVEQYIRQRGDLGVAFKVSMALENGGRVIKRTRGEWDALYEKWIKAPRG